MKPEPWTFELVWDPPINGTLLCTNYNRNSVIFGFPSRIRRTLIAETESTSSELINQVIQSARQLGFFIVCGTWQVPGNPTAIIIDVADKKKRKNVLNEKLKLIETVIESKIPETDHEAMEAIIFNYSVVEFLKLFDDALKLTSSNANELKNSVYFHDWTCGLGLLLMHHTTHLRLASVFAIDESVVAYDKTTSEAEHKATERGLRHRWSVERNAAGLAEYFAPPFP